MNGVPAVNRFWWAAPAAVVLVLALVAMLAGSPPRPPRPGSSFDAGPGGVRAAFLLLEGLGTDVSVSKRVAGGGACWVLFPRAAEGEESALDVRVRGGGRVLLADNGERFAAGLGLAVEAGQGGGAETDLRVGDEQLRLAPGKDLVTPHSRPDRVWPPGADEPLAGIFRHGKGEVWLLYRPDFLRNDRLRDADNAVILCRLAEAFADKDRIVFDEFFHGMRERPSAAELLLRPPALWVTLQGLALLGVLLWRSAPRFGALQNPEAPRRRSKEEYVDALAHLLALKGAYDEGARAVRDALSRDLEQALGLPPEAPPRELAARAFGTGPDAAALAAALRRDRPGGPDAANFVRALNELERLRRAFFHERHDR
jgi:hypothetical protein